MTRLRIPGSYPPDMSGQIQENFCLASGCLFSLSSKLNGYSSSRCVERT